jgi:hypothetical protein
MKETPNCGVEQLALTSSLLGAASKAFSVTARSICLSAPVRYCYSAFRKP